MEKFNRWSDPGTGINPFVPLSSKQGRSICSKLYQFTVSLTLAVLRIICLVAVFMVYFVLHSIFGVIPINVVKRPLVRVNDMVFVRLILMILGFWSIGASFADRNRLRLRGGKKGSRTSGVGSSVKAGDIIICNCT